MEPTNNFKSIFSHWINEQKYKENPRFNDATAERIVNLANLFSNLKNSELDLNKTGLKDDLNIETKVLIQAHYKAAYAVSTKSLNELSDFWDNNIDPTERTALLGATIIAKERFNTPELLHFLSDKSIRPEGEWFYKQAGPRRLHKLLTDRLHQDQTLYELSKVQNLPLEAQYMGIQVIKGTGFPDVETFKKEQVLKSTYDALKELVDVVTLELTPKGMALLNLLKWHLWLYPIDKNLEIHERLGFIKPGEIVQIPAKMEYEENFERYAGKNYFYMHNIPAFNVTGSSKVFNVADPEQRTYYLENHQKIVAAALKAQTSTEAKHILWNAFGMGAFLRGALPNREEMYELRKEVAKKFVAAFDAHLNQMSLKEREGFKLYLLGPTGESFAPNLREEPLDNYNAFVLAFADSAFKEHIILCPEEDAYVKAQKLADSYELEDGQIAPVSVINAANSKLLGNHWYLGFNKERTRFNANYAIDENATRRSVIAAFLFLMINGGLEAKGNCAENIARILNG